MHQDLDVSRRGALALISAGAASAAGAPVLAAGETERPTILGCPAQIADERTVLALLDDPDVRALEARLEAEISQWPRGSSGAGAARLGNAVLLWTAGLIFDELGYLQQEQPAFVLGTDTTPRTWFGHTLPGTGKAGDNPDAIYRSTIVDGRGTYEIVGQCDPEHPSAQLLFTIYSGTMTHPLKVEKQAKPNPDEGIIRLLGAVSDKDLAVAPDGTFRIVVGGPQTGAWLPTQPAPLSLGCRQMLLDWTTPPLRLAIRRLDKAAPAPVDPAELKRAVLADLGDFVRFWAKYPDLWLGGVAINTVAQPAPREGGWGFIGGVNFRLAEDEAVVVTLHPGSAKYMGFQLTDPWLIGPDNGRRQCSLNMAQSTPDADGRYTYVISQGDPGIANWLDTCGINEGFGLMRWQGFPGGRSSNAGLLHDFRIVKLSEAAALKGVARVTPEQRAKLLAARRRSYFSRFQAV